jgi:hypothetical protein
MVATTSVSTAGVVQPSSLRPAESSAVDASISRYLMAGERVRGVMDLGYKLGIGLLVLVALAWAFGLLPGAVRLF